MARYTCGTCGEAVYGLGDFADHIEEDGHDYEHVSAAVNDCESVDEPGVFELDGRKVVKCSECQTVSNAIASKCPECGSTDVLREER